MTKKRNLAFLCPIIIGLVLVVVGLFIRMPGGALTTYSFQNGKSTDHYNFDNRYSTIDEYVGGDAYNYIIGASLIAGKISGTMTVKAICIVSGILCACFGLTLMMLQEEKKSTELNTAATIHNQAEIGKLEVDASENQTISANNS